MRIHIPSVHSLVLCSFCLPLLTLLPLSLLSLLSPLSLFSLLSPLSPLLPLSLLPFLPPLCLFPLSPSLSLLFPLSFLPSSKAWPLYWGTTALLCWRVEHNDWEVWTSAGGVLSCSGEMSATLQWPTSIHQDSGLCTGTCPSNGCYDAILKDEMTAIGPDFHASWKHLKSTYQHLLAAWYMPRAHKNECLE